MEDDTYIWEELFDGHILERGFDYYCYDFVEEIVRKGDVLLAKVLGTRRYSVTIRLQDEKPIHMACSCPYAAGGTPCKHMAAVLYQWEDDRAAETGEVGEDAGIDGLTSEDVSEAGALSPGANFSPGGLGSETNPLYGSSGSGANSLCGEPKSRADSLPDGSVSGKRVDSDPAAMVSNADEALVREFLTLVLNENESYRSRFRLLTGAGPSAAEMRRYKQRIDRIVKTYMGRERFITYDRAGEFEIDMESFLDEEIMAMVDNGYLENAFELTMYIFQMLPGLDIDDSGGETSMLAESCVKYWKMIGEAAEEHLQTAMFDTCVNMLEDGELDFYEDYVETFLAQAFHTPALLERKLKYAAEMCARYAVPQKEGRVSYTAEVWIGRYLELLVETGVPDEEIHAFCRRYWQTETARQYAIDRYLSRGAYADAEKVLLENLDLFGPGIYSRRPYDRQLLDLYQESGEREKYTALLKNMVLTKRAGDMEMYRTLKAQYKSKEWEKIRSELLNAPSWGNYRQLIYEQEGMKEKLLEIVCENGSLSMAEQYTEVLKTDYPNELLDVYEQGLRSASERAASRNTYREWARILQKMKKIPGGEERVQKILRDWHLRYSNRPAMMDELRHV